MKEDIFKDLLYIYNTPLFRQGFMDFFMKMQQEGMESAKKYWNVYPDKNKFFDNAPDIFEMMIDFYSNMGFVSRKKYDEVAKENEDLKKENRLLKDTIREFNLKVFKEGGMQVQETLKSTIEQQIDLGKEVTKNFLDFFKQLQKK